MLFKSLILASASGSVGGATYAHNRAGMYIRNRSLVTNPASPRQQDQRTRFGNAATNWAVLTPAQRAAWATYAQNTPVVGRLGDSLVLTGQQMYIACMALRLQAGLSILTDAPTTFGLAALSPCGLAGNAGTPGDIDVSFVNTNGIFTAVGGGLLVFASIEQKPTINFFKGPYRFAGFVAGAVIAPTSPENIVLTNDLTAGNKVFARVIGIDAEGRMTAEQRLEAIIA